MGAYRVLQKPNNMKKLLSIDMLLMIAIICIPMLSVAQPPGFGGGDDVLDVPVDGGLSLLIASGVGYGVKQMRKKSNGKK
jgi:hypothetical protein